LADAADAHCFQPKNSESKRVAERSTNRKVPLSCGNRRGTNRNGSDKAGDDYPVQSYRQAVERAADRAGVEHWTAVVASLQGYRIRIRKDFGLDAAQAVLRHRGAKVTEVYAELDTTKAVEVALRIG
jgi:hypothetical protein